MSVAAEFGRSVLVTHFSEEQLTETVANGALVCKWAGVYVSHALSEHLKVTAVAGETEEA